MRDESNQELSGDGGPKDVVSLRYNSMMIDQKVHSDEIDESHKFVNDDIAFGSGDKPYD